MISLNISTKDISKAKENMKVFDIQKSYNKFQCDSNYIGLLGEMVFHKALTDSNISHEWISFIKKDWNAPDFILDGLSVDLKTTYSSSMWFQEPKFDIYIYAQVTPDNRSLRLISYMTKEGLNLAKCNGTAKPVIRGNRTDFVLSREDMLPIAGLRAITSLNDPIIYGGSLW